MEEIRITKNFKETQKLAELFGKKTLREKTNKQSIIIGLDGDLGLGKTTFVQGFAKGLGIREKILSPTFVLMKKFQIPNPRLQTLNQSLRDDKEQVGFKFPDRFRQKTKSGGGQFSKFQTFFHIDCYRIKSPKEILSIGFQEIISNPQNIVIIEWADKIQRILPKYTLMLKFELINENTRKIIINVKYSQR